MKCVRGIRDFEEYMFDLTMLDCEKKIMIMIII